jgi:hypothetical protein
MPCAAFSQGERQANNEKQQAFRNKDILFFFEISEQAQLSQDQQGYRGCHIDLE